MPPPDPDRRIPDPGFPDDDGAADPRVVAALTAYAGDRTRYADALATLVASRLLVPVIALLGEVEEGPDGLAREKTSDMATVLTTAPDGRRGLLAFTSTASLEAWNADARPVPVPARLAALSAVQEGASALVVDLAGPVMLAVEGDDLRRVAGGWTLVPTGDGAWAWIGPAAE